MERQMGMVERCARRLAAQHYADRFRLPEDAHLVRTNVDGNWYIFVSQVMTVIEAMREPTEAMEDWCLVNLEHRKTGIWIWQSLIDAALKETTNA